MSTCAQLNNLLKIPDQVVRLFASDYDVDTSNPVLKALDLVNNDWSAQITPDEWLVYLSPAPPTADELKGIELVMLISE